MKWLALIRNQYQRRWPTRDFWKALLHVRNYVSEEDIRKLPAFCYIDHILESLPILDFWLDVARDKGWLKEDRE